MLTVRFYHIDPEWTTVAGETVDGAVLFIWSDEYPSFGEAAMAAARFVANYHRERSLDTDQQLK